MAGTAKKASDYTGRQQEAAQKANLAAQEERAAELAMVTAQRKVAMETEVVDLSTPSTPVTVEETEVKVNDKEVVIRVNEDIHMTYAGETYDMEIGPKYKVPEVIAAHLEEKGLVWH